MKSCEKINWKLIATFEADSSLDSLDYETVSKLITSISSCKLENETDLKLNPCFLKVFKLSQNIIKYLISGQEFLIKQTKDISSELQCVKEEKIKIENDIANKLKKKISCLKLDLKQKEDIVIVQTEMLRALQNPNTSAQQKQDLKTCVNNVEITQKFPCKYCTKVYSSEHFLQLHHARRHPLVAKMRAENELFQQSSEKSAPPRTNFSSVVSRQSSNQSKMEDYVQNARSENVHAEISPGLQEETTKLKARLTAVERENDRLRCQLQESEKQATDSQLSMMELLQAKKEDKLKRQLKEEFECKLLMAKEEQEAEHKMQLERLQNSFMHEIKMMHLRQAETSATLENVRKMRLPGNCLGMLEDDDDDEDDNHPTGNVLIVDGSQGGKSKVDFSQSVRRSSQGAARVSLPCGSGLEGEDQVFAPGSMMLEESLKSASKQQQQQQQQQDQDVIKRLSRTQLSGTARSSQETKSPCANYENVQQKSSPSILKNKSQSPIQIVTASEIERSKPRKPIPPVVIKGIPARDNYKKPVQMSLEDARSMVELELQHKMLEYGVLPSIQAMNYSTYMETIRKINDSVQKLSPTHQAQYVELRNSIEKELESCLDGVTFFQKDVQPDVNEKTETSERIAVAEDAQISSQKFQCVKPDKTIEQAKADSKSKITNFSGTKTYPPRGNKSAAINEVSDGETDFSSKKKKVSGTEAPSIKEGKSTGIKGSNLNTEKADPSSKKTSISKSKKPSIRDGTLKGTKKSNPCEEAPRAKSDSAKARSGNTEIGNNQNHDQSTAKIDYDDYSITSVSDCENPDFVQTILYGANDEEEESPDYSEQMSEQLMKRQPEKKDVGILLKSTSTVSSIWSSEDGDAPKVEDLDSHKD